MEDRGWVGKNIFSEYFGMLPIGGFPVKEILRFGKG
jgi:hypothetical protein